MRYDYVVDRLNKAIYAPVLKHRLRESSADSHVKRQHRVDFITSAQVSSWLSFGLPAALVKVIVALVLVTGMHACRMLGRRLSIHIVWIWVVLFVGAPYFHGDTKAWAALCMLGSLWGIFLWTMAVKASNRPWVEGVILSISGFFPRLHHETAATPTGWQKFHQFAFDCVAVVLVAMMGEDLRAAKLWIVLIILIIESVAVFWHEGTFKNLFVFGGWALVTCRCATSIASENYWDGEILLIAAGTALSHLAGIFEFNLDPNLY